MFSSLPIFNPGIPYKKVRLYYFGRFDTSFNYINTNEIPCDLSRENLISFHVKYHRCYGYTINRAFHIRKLLSEMIWYFFGVCIINVTLHGRLEIRNFSCRVEKYFTRVFQHSKRNFVFPRGQVISHMYFSFQAYFLKVTGDTLSSFLRIYLKRMHEVQ